jgi:hypothetical protein
MKPVEWEGQHTETQPSTLEKGRESAQVAPKTVADHIAEAHGSNFPNKGEMLKK